MMTEQAASMDERLEDVFQEEIINAFVNITSFQHFARSKNGLCLDQINIKTIVEDHEDSVKDQKLEMLFQWREIQGEKATVQNIRHLVHKYFRGKNISDFIILDKGKYGFYKTRVLCKRSHVYVGVQINEITGTRTCAIKLIPENEQSLREARILVEIGKHVNLVSVIDVGKYHGDPHSYIFIAMEISWTQTVRNIFEECIKLGKPLQEFIAWSLAEQLMRAAEFLHSKHIIHRDIKPENILASEDWKHFKLTDFELSKWIRIGSTTIQTNANIGTNGYRSGESYNLKAKITVKADIFSAGVTIAEIMANGKHPFGQDPHLWSHNIINNKKLDLSHIRVSYKFKVTHFIKRMLEIDPKKRPTAEEVLINVQTLQLKYQQTTVDQSSATASKAISELSITKKANAIIVFNDSDKHLYSYKLSTDKWSQMKEFPRHDSWSTTVVLDKHIYILHCQEFYQLDYSDPAAEWKKMSMIEDHGWNPPAAVLNGLIYVCGKSGNAETSRSVERYDAILDRWDHICDMNIGRRYPCVVATEDHIYCMGGQNEQQEPLQSVERLDEKLNKWEFFESTPRTISFVSASAAVVKNQIYVADTDGVLCYDIQNNLWSEMKLSNHWPFIKNWFVKIIAIDEELYIIGCIHERYNNSAIYLLEPETKHVTLVKTLWDADILRVNCSLAVDL